MSRSIARARAGRERTTLYQEITDKIITELLKAGRVPWVRSWGTVAAEASLTVPKNAATHNHYWGINVLILWGAVIDRGFSTQNWLTFRQALRLGGGVRKGERGTTVLYADHFVPDEKRRRAARDGGKPNAIRFLKRLTVFNADQCQDLPREVTRDYIPQHFPQREHDASPDQAILFTACDALEHDALQKAISPTRQIDHWLASDFEGTIVFDEGDEHAAGENSECRAHDNLNAIPLAVSAGDKAAA